MIILRNKLFSIYSIEDKLKINCSAGLISLVKTNLDEVINIFKGHKQEEKPNDRILVYDVFVNETKIGIIQLMENSAVEIELDWINLNDKVGEYFISLLEYFINLAKSCRYRLFTLGLYKCTDDLKNKCLDFYGFVNDSVGNIKGVTKLYRPL